ncbi:DUF2207 family protein [Parenemella sanctibonifatiensis]|uniref:DUF2207 domain-containing protein n=1 Tax=Parenemella sanctibonifatiensis TaxID=2016505 RepID=A0A255E5B9_9ACTN|nr:DUF2207 domain-containing protein [Parenemella sanctibonifatiensis]OYN84705.1 hypothetical protein CGZ92_12835 [Parenemella sanctibonifatiensis]
MYGSVHLRRIPAVIMVALLALTVWAGGALPARAEGMIETYDVQAVLNEDGTIDVDATITFASDGVPGTLEQRFGTTEAALDNREYRYQLSKVEVTADGSPVSGATITEEGDATVVTVPTDGLNGSVTISYTVAGATHAKGPDATDVRWRALQGLSAPVRDFNAVVSAPPGSVGIDCNAGSPDAPSKCNEWVTSTHSNPDPYFRAGPLGQGQMVEFSLVYPTSVVPVTEDLQERWSLDRAFSFSPLPLLVALGVLVVGGLVLWSMHRRAGRDAAPTGDPIRIAEFRAAGEGLSEFQVIEDVRPGQVGTMFDERVDPIDITASLIDLAVRGHLHITELPRANEYDPTDWEIRRGKAQGEGLHAYEQRIIEALTPQADSVTKVSQLPETLPNSLNDIQSALYDELVERGWYEQRPDSTRNLWKTGGWIGLGVAVVATVVLAAFTGFGLLGLVLVMLALGLLLVSEEMPARTANGSRILEGMLALRADLVNRPTDEMPPGKELRELSELLPYAVVLGGSDRWLKAFVESDDDDVADPRDLSWYHTPDTWHLRDFPGSMRNFITSVSGVLFLR